MIDEEEMKERIIKRKEGASMRVKEIHRELSL